MSVSEKKEKKAKPSIEDSPSDMSTSQADLQKSSPSGSPCICVVKRNIACVLHGG
jgi:hypothetical protein